MIWKNAIFLIIVGAIASQYKEMDYFWLCFGAYMVLLVVYHSLSLYFIPEQHKKRVGKELFEKYINLEKNEKKKNFLKNNYIIDPYYDLIPQEDFISLHLIPKEKKKIGYPDLIKLRIYPDIEEIELENYWINSLRYSKEDGIIKKWFIENNIDYFNMKEDDIVEFKNKFVVMNYFDEHIERMNITVQRKIIKACYVSILFGLFIGTIILIKGILNLGWLHLLDPQAVFLIFVALSAMLFSIPFLTVYKEDRNVPFKSNIEKEEIKDYKEFIKDGFMKNNYFFFQNEYIEHDERKELNNYIFKINNDNKYLPTYILINPNTEEKKYIWGQEINNPETRINTLKIINWANKHNIELLNLQENKEKVNKSDIEILLEKAQFN